MQEASIICPVKDNDGAPVDKAHFNLELALIDGFDGFTTQNVKGVWRDAANGRTFRDDSIEYRVAADYAANPRLAARLENIAARFARDAGQLAMYVKHANGEIVLVSPRQARDGFGEDLAPFAERKRQLYG